MIKRSIVTVLIGIVGITAFVATRPHTTKERAPKAPKQAVVAEASVEETQTDQVEESEPAAAPPIKYATTAIRVRSTPEINDSNLLGAIYINSQVEITNDLGDWDEINYNGRTAYVYESLLSDTPVVIQVAAPAASNTNTKTSNTAKTSSTSNSASSFKRDGVIKYGGYRWTWYSQRVLPGGGLKIPGRHLDENGYVCDQNGRIVVACSTLSKGTIMNSPLGKECIVLDSCPSRGTIDVYVGW